MLLYDEAYESFEKNTERIETCQVKRTLPGFNSVNMEQMRNVNGWTRLARCRQALDALDRQGWARSFHQKHFHDQFIRASMRIFWKLEPAGSFSRDHCKILEYNGWNSLPQEMLISTPRRFGKTISISMFAAAMLFAAPCVEVSIYSTCLRISKCAHTVLTLEIWRTQN